MNIYIYICIERQRRLFLRFLRSKCRAPRTANGGKNDSTDWENSCETRWEHERGRKTVRKGRTGGEKRKFCQNVEKKEKKRYEAR